MDLTQHGEVFGGDERKAGGGGESGRALDATTAPSVGAEPAQPLATSVGFQDTNGPGGTNVVTFAAPDQGVLDAFLGGDEEAADGGGIHHFGEPAEQRALFDPSAAYASPELGSQQDAWSQQATPHRTLFQEHYASGFEVEQGEQELNQREWSYVRGDSEYIRTVGKWHVFGYTQDGLTFTYFYQRADTGESTWEKPAAVRLAEVEDERLKHLNPFAYEGLDTDADPRPWVPPDPEKARAFADTAIYGRGRAPLCRTSDTELVHMGVGVPLYFLTLKSMAILFLLLTLVSLPAQLMYSKGTRIPSGQTTSPLWSSLSLGNAGSRIGLELQATADGQVVEVTPANTTVVHMFGSDFTAADASYLVSFVDFAGSLVFLLYIVYFWRMIRRIAGVAEARRVSAKDYTVYIRRLPIDATEKEVRRFFSSRFNLDDQEKTTTVHTTSTYFAQARYAKKWAAKRKSLASTPGRSPTAGKPPVGKRPQPARKTRYERWMEAQRAQQRYSRRHLQAIYGEYAPKTKSATTTTRADGRQFDYSELVTGADGQVVAAGVTAVEADDPEAAGALKASSLPTAGRATGKHRRNSTFGHVVLRRDSAGGMFAMQPVINFTHHHKPEYAGSWVADVSLVRGMGEHIRAYLNLVGVVEKLRSARARVKMYSEGTPLKKGADDDKRKKAAEEVLQLGFTLERVRQELGDSNMLDEDDSAGTDEDEEDAADDDDEDEEEGEGDGADAAKEKPSKAKTRRQRRRERRRAGVKECHGAFVTFNHEESFRRCVAAYSGSTTQLGRLFQSKELRFRGEHRLEVKPAPDPSDVLWENADSTDCDRCVRQLCTGLCMTAMLIISFSLILVAQIAYENLNKLIPDLSVCDTELPAATLGSFDRLVALEADLPAAYFDLTVGNDTIRAEQCGATSSLQWIGYEQLWQAGEVNYTATACSESGNARICPNDPTASASGQVPEQCACISPDSPDVQCERLACMDSSQVDEDRGRFCSAGQTTYASSTVIGCHCMQRFTSLIKSMSTSDAVQTFVQDSSSLCGGFAQQYLLAQSLSLLASFTAAFVNFLLSLSINFLVAAERHVSRSGQELALVTKNTFAQIVNTAFIVLLVHMGLPDKSELRTVNTMLRPIGVLQGLYTSFSPAWYSSVGVMLTTTLLLSAVLPAIMPIYHVSKAAILRCISATSQQAIAKRGSITTQHQLNKLFVGPPLDMASRLPNILTLMFVCYMYSPGLPALLPFAALGMVVQYTLDRCLLLRFYSKPPAYGPKMALYTLAVLPIALLAHSLFAVLMFGELSLLPSDVLPAARNALASADTNTNPESRSYFEYWLQVTNGFDALGLVPKLVRINCFPHFVLFATLLILVLLWYIVRYGIIGCVLSCGWAELCNCSDALTTRRKWSSPFTAPFGKAVGEPIRAHGCWGCADRKREALATYKPAKISKLEVTQGWRIEDVRGLPVLRKVYPKPDKARKRKGATPSHAETPGNASTPGNGSTPDATGTPMGGGLKLKRTWQVIQDSGLSSYDPIQNPAYRGALLARGDVALAREVSDLARPGTSGGIPEARMPRPAELEGEALEAQEQAGAAMAALVEAEGGAPMLASGSTALARRRHKREEAAAGHDFEGMQDYDVDGEGPEQGQADVEAGFRVHTAGLQEEASAMGGGADGTMGVTTQTPINGLAAAGGADEDAAWGGQTQHGVFDVAGSA